MKATDLEEAGRDNFGRPLFRHTQTGMYYCLLAGGLTFDDVYAGATELIFKGIGIDAPPSHPVELKRPD